MKQAIRNLPIGIQSFEKLRMNNCIYVDKTAFIYKLVHTNVPYFLSRPRRFGKSLLLSTLKAYWEGRKDLFKGLKIEELEKDNENAWEPYPVFYLDFNTGNYKEDMALEGILEEHLVNWEEQYGLKPGSEQSLPLRFKKVIRAAKDQTGRGCVILVDEYDKAMLETMENEALLEHNKETFKGFFSNLKSGDENIQFAFITGVTKFSKVSIFNDLNQLVDISFDDDYAALCGITQEEISVHLRPETEMMAAKLEITPDDCMKQLKAAYDGYHFSADGVGVYNPYSLLTALMKRRFGSFWYETGTPTFLVHRLRELDFDVRKLSDRTIQSTEAILSDFRADDPDPVPLLYQTGYLTILDAPEDDILTLGFPNEEVSHAFLQSLLPEYVNEYGSGSGKDIFSIKRYVETGDLESLKNAMTALFAGISYTTNDTPFEHYFQTVIYIVFTLLGKYAACELHTGNGRIDCTVETRQFIYIFEFKRDDSAEKALRHIEDMHYADTYAADKRTLYKIGVNFSSETRQMDGWEVADLL